MGPRAAKEIKQEGVNPSENMQLAKDSGFTASSTFFVLLSLTGLQPSPRLSTTPEAKGRLRNEHSTSQGWPCGHIGEGLAYLNLKEKPGTGLAEPEKHSLCSSNGDNYGKKVEFLRV